MEIPSLPGWMDAGRLAIIAALTLMLVQYIKSFIPEKLIKVVAIAIALIVAGLMQLAEINIYAKIALYAIFAVTAADTGYKFFSNAKSPSFTLPTKAQEAAEEKK